MDPSLSFLQHNICRAARGTFTHINTDTEHCWLHRTPQWPFWGHNPPPVPPHLLASANLLCFYYPVISRMLSKWNHIQR